jgi:predicted nucleic acid-binding protein
MNYATVIRAGSTNLADRAMNDVRADPETEPEPEAAAHEQPASANEAVAETIPERLVFDTEPLIAHATSEHGKSVVDTYLDAVRDGDVDGFINQVNLTETRYVIGRVSGRKMADRYIGWLFDIGVRSIGVNNLWIDAADYILEYNPALGDSFALATADHVDASLLIGGDSDFDGITEVHLIRFRDGSG